MSAYDYPSPRHRRKHGPRGYRVASDYREWLRDEFVFRCVYCLEREKWTNVLGHFHVEHFLPAALNPESQLEYDNLLYSCQACNLLKGSQIVPDPLKVFTQRTILVTKSGALQGRTKEARRLIEVLQLNGASYQLRRRLILAILKTVKKTNRLLYDELMGFPDDLPELRKLKPPGGNSRPGGIKKSFQALREAGKLPLVY